MSRMYGVENGGKLYKYDRSKNIWNVTNVGLSEIKSIVADGDNLWVGNKWMGL